MQTNGIKNEGRLLCLNKQDIGEGMVESSYTCVRLHCTCVSMSRVVRNVSESFLYVGWAGKAVCRIFHRWLSRIVHAIRSTIRWLAGWLCVRARACHWDSVRRSRLLIPIASCSSKAPADCDIFDCLSIRYRYHECMCHFFLDAHTFSHSLKFNDLFFFFLLWFSFFFS